MMFVDFLRNVEVFKSLNDQELEMVSGLCVEKEFLQGEKLFDEGGSADHFWIMKQGQVDLRFDLPGRVSSEETTLLSLTGNKIFGWSSMVPPYIYKLPAYCATPRCKVLQIKKDRLLKLFQDYPRIGYQVMADLIEIVGNRFDLMQESALNAMP